jgi:hypothetical protein
MVKKMKTKLVQISELHPPENITPSIGTTISGILVLLPLALLLVGLYSGVIGI